MRKTKLYVQALFIGSLLLLTIEANAQYIQSAAGRLFHVQEALLPRAGSSNFAFNGDVHVTPSAYTPGYDGITNDVGNGAHSMGRLFFNFDYSLHDMFAIVANTTVLNTIYHYQNVQNQVQSKMFNFIENITLGGKFGSVGLANNYAYFGLLATVNIPIASPGNYNSYGNPYSAGGFEAGIWALFSIYFDNFFPQESFNISINAGYYNYFDAGKDLSNYNAYTLPNTNAGSSSFNYSVGFKLPVLFVKFIFEYWGWIFLSQPSRYAYTREDMSFITAGVRFNLEFFTLDLSFDYQVTGQVDNTLYADQDQIFAATSKILKRPSNVPSNYTPWRIGAGIGFAITGPYSISQYIQRQPPPIDFTAESRNTKVMLKRIEEVSLDKLSLSERLNELRKRRQDIERNLQILKQILKDESATSNQSVKPPDDRPALIQQPAPVNESTPTMTTPVSETPSPASGSKKDAPKDVSPVMSTPPIEPTPSTTAPSEPKVVVPVEETTTSTKKTIRRRRSGTSEESTQPTDGNAPTAPSTTTPASAPVAPAQSSSKKRRTTTPVKKPSTKRVSKSSGDNSSTSSNEEYEEVITTVETKKK